MDKAEAVILWVPVNLSVVLLLVAIIDLFSQGLLYSLLVAFLAGPLVLIVAIVYYRELFKVFKKNS